MSTSRAALCSTDDVYDDGSERSTQEDDPAPLEWRTAEDLRVIEETMVRVMESQKLRDKLADAFVPDELVEDCLEGYSHAMVHSPGWFFETQADMVKFSMRAWSFSEGRREPMFVVPTLVRFSTDRHGEAIDAKKQEVLMTDFRLPHEFFPAARAIKRRIIYHAGPTNSGKTYNALQRMKAARRGLFLSPLRLLAAEVYTRLNAEGVYCDLMTGQERRRVPGARHLSCTVEMANLDAHYNVAVLDEVQMLGDEYRGDGWARALMGLQVPEIHVCGDPTAMGLVRWLCQQMGDEFEVEEYTRMTPLHVEPSLNGDLSKVEAGDCIVAFSRNDIYALKHLVESKTKFRCGVVYGALPSETRSEQAASFNRRDGGFDVLIASDAIGMGLNLNIRRVIFATVRKFDGHGVVTVSAPMLKQIAGRAGRRSSDFEEGRATTLVARDFPILDRALKRPPVQQKRLYIKPSCEQLEFFHNATLNRERARKAHAVAKRAASKADPMGRWGAAEAAKEEAAERVAAPRSLGEGNRIDFVALLTRFRDLTRLDHHYRIVSFRSTLQCAQVLQDLDMSLADRYTWSVAPVNLRSPFQKSIFQQFATAFSANRGVVADLELPTTAPTSDQALRRLEEQHTVLDLYCWLASRYPGHFVDGEAALQERAKAQALIKTSIESNLSLSGAARERLRHLVRAMPDPLEAAMGGGDDEPMFQRRGRAGGHRSKRNGGPRGGSGMVRNREDSGSRKGENQKQGKGKGKGQGQGKGQGKKKQPKQQNKQQQRGKQGSRTSNTKDADASRTTQQSEGARDQPSSKPGDRSDGATAKATLHGGSFAARLKQARHRQQPSAVPNPTDREERRRRLS